MAKIIEIFKNKWFLQGLVVLALFLVIWFVTPLIAIAGNEIFSSIASRLLFMLVVFGLWMLHIYRVKHLVKKNNAELTEGLSGNDENDRVDAETKLIKERFEQAIKKIGSGKDDKNRYYLYEKPWYIIIGPPAAGKTTALVNAGLSFRDETELGKTSLKGIGGTRNCDWWFTEEAVLIDTAGRFTTQEADEKVDAASWTKFMALLKKYRKQRPINGVLVAVAIDDIINLSDFDQQNRAHHIRKRLTELIKHLGIHFPVYFMFTKCDLIAGFEEFFGKFNREQSKQVWGETFPWREKSNVSENLNNFADGYQQLIERLASQMLVQMNNQHDSDAKPAMVGFPAQMISLKEPISQFLFEAFGDDYIQRAIDLRGVYFTSGTQEGTPLDRLIGGLVKDFNIQNNASMASRESGKSFFLQDLLKEVVIPEAELAGVDQKIQRRNRWVRRAAFAGALACLSMTSVMWAWSYKSNANNTLATNSLIEQSNKQAVTGKMIGADFLAVLPQLNHLREASFVFDNPEWSERGGLYQGNSIGNQAKAAYLKALENKLLPVIGARLQELLIDLSNLGETELTYEVLKAYLMYAGLNKPEGVEVNIELLQSISRADWQELYRGQPNAVQQLIAHHDYLLANGNLMLNRSKQDDQVISYARAQLRRTPLSEQVYNSIKQQLLKERSNDISFNDLAGPMGVDVFNHVDGKPLEELYIPGLFTKVGFYKSFMLQYEVQSSDYLTNNWVLGKHSVHAKKTNEEQLKAEVFRRYYRDYIETWDGLLKKLRYKQANNVDHGMDIIEASTSYNGPIQLILEMVAEQTNLAAALPDTEASQGVADAVGQVSGSGQRAISKLSRLARTADKMGISSKLGEPVTKAFANYHRLADTNRGETPLARLMTEADRFQQYLEQVLLEGFTETPALQAVKDRIEGVGNDRFGALRRRTNGIPAYPKQWISDMRQLGWSMLMQKSRLELNRLWDDEVESYYRQAIAGHYPVDVNAQNDIELLDFAEFFRPKGKLDSFVQTHLLPFINTRRTPWQAKAIDGQFNIDNQTVYHLHRAKQISDMFFTSGSSKPQISFHVTPRELDIEVSRFVFYLGDQVITSVHGPRESEQMYWPLKGGNERTRIQVIDNDGKRASTSQNGPWSLFKMLDNSRMKRTERGSEYIVTFELDGYSASFNVSADTAFNPLGDKLIQGFVLPESL